MAFRAPLLGYNTNVRHKGKLYHIQTEDSGIDHPHVITHLFADGGRIVASKKTSYADRVGSDGLPDQVKKLMQGQHKAMFISLRDGIYDEDASSRDDVAEPTTGVQPADKARAESAPAQGSIEHDGVSALEAGAPAAADASPSGDEHEGAPQPRVELTASSVRTSEEAPPASPAVAEDTDDEQMVTHPPQPADGSREAEHAPLYPPSPAAPRMTVEANAHAAGMTSSVVAKSGGARSLFGGDLLSDKSLDEVILNYLAANEKDG